MQPQQYLSPPRPPSQPQKQPFRQAATPPTLTTSNTLPVLPAKSIVALDMGNGDINWRIPLES